MGVFVFLIFGSSLASWFCSSPEKICQLFSSKDELVKCVNAAKTLRNASKGRQEMCDKMACSKKPTYVLNCLTAKLTSKSENRCLRFLKAGRYKAGNICLNKLNGAEEDQISETEFRKCLPLTQFNEGRQDLDNDRSNFELCMEKVVESPAPSPAPAPAAPEIRFQN